MPLKRIVVFALVSLLLAGCSQLTEPVGESRVDTNIVGTWLRDDDSSGTVTVGDEAMVFGSDGSITYSDYLDPDGLGPEVEDWHNYSYGRTWVNGYFHDYSTNTNANNYISGSILADDGSGDYILLFQYRYNPYPDTFDVLTENSSEGTWTRIP